jgi:hypothetical protein
VTIACYKYNSKKLMSHFTRNKTYLNENHIIYRRDPVNDKPSRVFDWGCYYENGTRECYTLFNSKAKINTFKGLKWHLYVLWYLNPQMDQELFESLTEYICNKRYGFTTFEVSRQLQQSMIYDVSLMDLETPPPNKLRKVIFNDFTGLETRQKLSIVGKLVGKSSISSNEIYDAMILINHANGKITVAKLARSLGCSTRTIYRHMTNELKKEKELLNQQLQS